MPTISTSSCAHEQKVPVGMVDGCGYDGQQNNAICDVCEPCQTIEAHSSQFFADFQLIGYAYELLKCPHVEIWRFSWRRQQTDRQTN